MSDSLQTTIAKWVSVRNGAIPDEAMIGGIDISGEHLHIGRANHNGDIIPGKVVPSHEVCYIAYGRKEHGKSEYQVLVYGAADYCWSQASNGIVPNGAIEGGVTETGEKLFIGRVYHEGALCVGKVHPSHQCCYVACGGNEHTYRIYEVLYCPSG